MYTIYQVTNIVNGKKYIGFTTKTPETRWKRHMVIAKYAKSKTHFQQAIIKHGSKNFSLSVLCWGEDIQAGLKIAEPLMIEMFHPEYNKTKGGDGVPGLVITEKHRRALSVAMRGKNTGPKTPEHIRNLMGNQNSRGAKRSTEWKNNQSIRVSSLPKISCSQCGTIGSTLAMKRWHFENCKNK